MQRRTVTEKLAPMILLRFLVASSLLALSASCSSGGLSHLDSSLVHNGRPTEAEAYSDFLIARFAAMTNDPQKAAEHYALAIDSAPEKSGIADRALFASLLSGDYREGVRVAKRANTLGSEAALVRLTLAVEALRVGREDDAKQMLEQSRFGPFNRMIARGLSAWRVVDTQGTDAAVRYLEDGLSGDPRLDSATLYMMGLIEMSAGNDDAALSVFDTLWDSSARLAVGVEAHAQLLASRGQRDRALEILNTFDEQVGHNASIARLSQAIASGDKIKVRRLTPDEGAALAIYVPAAALMSQTSDDVSAVYFVLALALAWMLRRTRVGLTLRVVGDSSDAARALGIRPARVRILATAFGGALAGVGGAYLSLFYPGSWNEGISSGQGLIAVALVIFARWSPVNCFFAALLFGAAGALGPALQSVGVTSGYYLSYAAPFVLTLVVLILSSSKSGALTGAPRELSITK